jgi:hypothetical protein
MTHTDVIHEYTHHTHAICFLTRLNVNFIVSANNHIRVMIFGMWVKRILFELWLRVSEVGEHVQKKLWQRIELYGRKPIPPVCVDVTDWTQHEYRYRCKSTSLDGINCKSQWRHYCFVWEQFVRIKTAPRQAATLQSSMTLHCCPLGDIVEHMRVLFQREMSLSFVSKFLYMFSPVTAAVDQLGAPVLTAHFYTCWMLSTMKSVLYRSNT